MKYNFSLLLMLFAHLAHAFNEEELENLHQQINAGQRVFAVGYDLQGADLRAMNLKEANFTHANLRGVNFSHSNLSRAIFHQADLSKINFQKAKLKRADLAYANINGARFKGARLLGIHYDHIRSAKGTLFEDKQELFRRISHEEKIYKIKKELSTVDRQSIRIDKALTLKEIHQLLYAELRNLHKVKKEYVVLDFRSFNLLNKGLEGFEVSLLSQDSNIVIHHCLDFLQKPFFSSLVEEVTPICKYQALVVLLKNKGIISAQKKQPHALLDLHGKAPLSAKFKRIDQFIKKSHRNHAHAIEIITGRGLHNPKGIMGILWRQCYKYLCNEKFETSIQKISSINKEGGWKVTLNNNHQTKKVKRKIRGKHTVSLYGLNMPFKNVKLSIASALEEQTKSVASKSAKKSNESKLRSNIMLVFSNL